MVNEQDFRRLKQQADQARRARDIATGQLEAAKEQLQKDFGCKDINAAEKLLVQLNKEARAAEKVFNVAVAAFEEKWDGNDGKD